MGIYGSAHTGLDEMDYSTQTIPCMANQLKEHYGDNIYSENLSWIAKDIEPSRVDYITLQGLFTDCITLTGNVSGIAVASAAVFLFVQLTGRLANIQIKRRYKL
jgi:hypothetical protein